MTSVGALPEGVKPDDWFAVGDRVNEVDGSSCDGMSDVEITAILSTPVSTEPNNETPVTQKHFVTLLKNTLTGNSDNAIRGWRMRVFGICIINLSVWLTFGAAPNLTAKAVIMAIGSLISMASCRDQRKIPRQKSGPDLSVENTIEIHH